VSAALCPGVTLARALTRGANQGAAKKVVMNTDELSDDEEYNKVPRPYAMLLLPLHPAHLLLASRSQKKKKPPEQDTKQKKKKKEWISGFETKVQWTNSSNCAVLILSRSQNAHRFAFSTAGRAILDRQVDSRSLSLLPLPRRLHIYSAHG
jgi:hypothetical protein